MPKDPEPRGRELRQLFGQLCDQAADVAASFRACRCSKDVGSTGTDGRGGVNALRRELVVIRQRVGAGSAGDDLSDEDLKRTLARLESQVSALKQRTTAPSDEPAESTRTVGTQTEPAIPESREPALDGATTTPTDGRAESAAKIGTPTSPGEERTESPTGDDVPVEPAHGPLTLMRLPPEVRARIWWEALRPEAGFVPIVPWAALQNGYVDNNGRIRARIRTRSSGRFHRARTALIDRKSAPYANERAPEARGFAHSWMRAGEHWGAPWTGGWALLHVNKRVYEEAEAAYWRRVAADGLMLSFGCGIHMADYWGLAVARTFFNDFTTLYLQNIQRVHLDLRRPDRDDGPNGTRLTSLRHLSLTLGGWVPDVRQTPWIEDTDYPDARLQSSQHWVTRLQNITGLTRLRLRVMYAPRDPDTINARLDRDPGVQRTIHFMSMLRGSMLVNGDALGVGNMRAWANKRQLEFATADRFRIVVQCDDSWDEESKEHRHYVEDDEYDRLDGPNNFGDKFRWDPDADS
ncbi:hypothetical protein INS49_010572 [Diaporthe citri]|uniref:uncharacterized protein n=1 Tax=Diaporthe citri TaxID=83186 RepID=UPI001C807A6F|nr:uncharacterized protein INS49_010572 [Diaporthe citri]KAG6362342.1 hypothetical protein INS49_010572 [Diaporthe citri]